MSRKAEYKLRASDFVPLKGLDEYEYRNIFSKKQILNKIETRQMGLFYYNAIMFIGGISALGYNIISGLEKLFK